MLPVPRAIAVVCALANPLAASWVRGLAADHRVVVVDLRSAPPTRAELADWGIPADQPVVTAGGTLDAAARAAVAAALGGPPELIVSWWGTGILPLALAVKGAFPGSRLTHCVDTLPDAGTLAAEVREALRYRRADGGVDGYIFYSQQMRRRFCRLVPPARAKPALVMVEPFPLSVHARAGTDAPPLERRGDGPHVIFTGRSDLLFRRDRRMRKDAVGPFLRALAERGVEVFVKPELDGQTLPPGLHCYPAFTNADLFAGRFAAHIDAYDAHLVIYNEWNATIRRRVACGLSTRLALALAATSPIVVSETATFAAELGSVTMRFSGPDDLAASLHDRAALAAQRRVLAERHTEFAWESQAPRVEDHLGDVCKKAYA